MNETLRLLLYAACIIALFLLCRWTIYLVGW